eukprot:TRINITY_DN5218_c1_g1_i1.p1 TRINITY_DN5218_c1_g1~~TRINITY_DN5218_c1_g1_i1.p1  ORF type:complete len:440 (+),score=64.12 TRINITY_DN5218_c1_g1_i1:62-1381(+)
MRALPRRCAAVAALLAAAGAQKLDSGGCVEARAAGCGSVLAGGSGYDAWCFSSVPRLYRTHLQYGAPRGPGSGTNSSALCMPRLVTANRSERISFREVAARARTMVCCGFGSLWFRRYGPRVLPSVLPGEGEGDWWDVDDFPVAVARVRHRCNFPTRSRPRAVSCWRSGGGSALGTVPVPDSLAAIWAPPHRDQNSEVVTSRFQAYDPFLHALVRRLLDRRPALVLDVGANLGYVTLYALAMGHRTVSFEAFPRTRRKLELSVWLSGAWGRGEVVGAAVGDEPGEAKLAVTQGNYGGNHVVADEGEAAAAGQPVVTVPVTTIDEALASRASRGVPAVPLLIKLDVEGRELAALRGAEDTLQRARPYLVVETCQPKAFGSAADVSPACAPPEPLFQHLKSRGYACATTLEQALAGTWDVQAVLSPRRRSAVTANVVCAPT